jgi:hypothetical protein
MAKGNWKMFAIPNAHQMAFQIENELFLTLSHHEDRKKRTNNQSIEHFSEMESPGKSKC